MKLTVKERLMFANQMKILEALYPDEAEYYKNHREALESGYELHYNWIFEHFSDGLTEKECNEVLDILEMYYRMIVTFKHLPSERKKELKIKELSFPGFDGNNETSQLSYAIYFMHDLNRFSEVRDDSEFPDYNSHSPTLNTYRKMLDLFSSSIKEENTLSFQLLKKLIEMQPTSLR